MWNFCFTLLIVYSATKNQFAKVMSITMFYSMIPGGIGVISIKLEWLGVFLSRWWSPWDSLFL